jgi:hypothetical protein
MLFDQRQGLQAGDVSRRKICRLANTERDASERDFFVGAEWGSTTASHENLPSSAKIFSNSTPAFKGPPRKCPHPDEGRWEGFAMRVGVFALVDSLTADFGHSS